MAGEPDDLLLLDRDEAGDRLAAERDFGFAGPCLAETLPHPGGDLVLFGGERAAHDNSGLLQSIIRRPGIGQGIELDEHVHLMTLVEKVPDGQISRCGDFLPSLLCKNISLKPSGKSALS